MTEQKINSDAVIMPIVKGKSLQAIESDTYYEGCAFYLEADEHYSVVSSVFDNCSFRSDVVFRVIDECKFYECNYSNHVVFKQSKMSDLRIALSSVAESGVALTQFNWAESNSIENLRIPKSISKLQSLKLFNLKEHVYHESSGEVDSSRQTGNRDFELGELCSVLALEQLQIELCTMTLIVSENIGQLKNLCDVSFKNCTELPEEMAKLAHLQTLKLEDCQFDRLPKAISEMTALKKLSLLNCFQTLNDGADFQLIPSNLASCQLPNEFSKLGMLESVRLDIIQVARFPASLAELPRLNYLSLSHCYADEWPTDGFTHLTELCIFYAIAQEIPKVFYNAVGLTKLTVIDWPDFKVSEDILAFSQLQYLKIDVTAYSDVVAQLTALRHLELNLDGSMPQLPSSINALDNITSLTLNCDDAYLLDNNLDTVEYRARALLGGMLNLCARLTSLELHTCLMEEIFDGITFDCLTSLTITNAVLSEKVLAQICEMQSLQVLRLASINRFHHRDDKHYILPEAMGDMPALKQIICNQDLSNIGIPESLKNKPGLEIVYIRDL